MRIVTWGVVCLTALVMAACGGGGGDGHGDSGNAGSGSGSGSGGSGGAGGTTSSNVAPITVGSALGSRTPNLPYTSVTVCVPGGTCQTIDNILVDTGSVGLRLMASALTLNLPQATLQGQTLAECGQFVDGYTWGTIRSADVRIAGESADAARVHVIGDSALPTVPSACSASGGAALNTPQSFHANGVLGIGLYAQDCGAACANAAIGPVYYTCVSDGNCASAAVPLTQQLQHPVSLFAQDNNGTLIALPAVATGGATSASGQLIFGIGTQANNALGAATALSTSAAGFLSATYNGTTYLTSFVDSGSNGLYFDDASVTQCTSPLSGLYCPSSPLSLSVALSGSNGVSAQASLSLSSALTQLNSNNGGNNALPSLGGVYGDATSFDFGLPFFYGRRVFTAIEDRTTPAGNGPYVAF